MTSTDINSQHGSDKGTEMSTWDRIRNDETLASARQKISFRDFVHIMRHAQSDYRAVLTALIDNPHGCRLCDYGVLRNPSKSHDDDCPYAVAKSLLQPRDEQGASPHTLTNEDRG